MNAKRGSAGALSEVEGATAVDTRPPSRHVGTAEDKKADLLRRVPQKIGSYPRRAAERFTFGDAIFLWRVEYSPAFVK